MNSPDSPADFVFGTFVALHNVYTCWYSYIMAGDATYQGLRRAAVSIWLSSLIEFAGKRRERATAVATFKDSGISLDLINDVLSETDAGVDEVLVCLNREDQCTLWLLRNQAVHAHLSLYFHDGIGVPIYHSESRTVVKESMSRAALDFALEKSTEFRPMQRFASLLKSNVLLSEPSRVLGNDALDKYHVALFGRAFP